MQTKTLLIALAAVAIIGGGAYAFASTPKDQVAAVAQTSSVVAQQVDPLDSSKGGPSIPADTTQGATSPAVMTGSSTSVKKYKDGTYSATGNYNSPGGAETIGVMIVLKNGIIVDSTVTPMAFRPASKMIQADFTANYKQFVTGKNIDEVNLDKVSGSSLTPIGFNDALTQVKAQAKA